MTKDLKYPHPLVLAIIGLTVIHTQPTKKNCHRSQDVYFSIVLEVVPTGLQKLIVKFVGILGADC